MYFLVVLGASQDQKVKSSNIKLLLLLLLFYLTCPLALRINAAQSADRAVTAKSDKRKVRQNNEPCTSELKLQEKDSQNVATLTDEINKTVNARMT